MGVTATWALARAVAIEACAAGARAASAYFRRPGLTVETKTDESPVTAADRASEQAVRAILAEAFPADGWVGEETGTSVRLDTGGGEPSGRRWIVDPIDGTRNFVRGIPLWSVLVACEEDLPGGARVIASAVAFPGIGETYDAVRGGGARCNGESIRVSAVATLAKACFAYYTGPWFSQHGLGRVFQALSGGSEMQRGGGDAWMHCLVASGRADLCVEPGLQVWDVAATSLVVEEAGGRVSDLAGNQDLRTGSAILSNGHLHDGTVALIHRLRDG